MSHVYKVLLWSLPRRHDIGLARDGKGQTRRRLPSIRALSAHVKRDVFWHFQLASSRTLQQTHVRLQRGRRLTANIPIPITSQATSKTKHRDTDLHRKLQREATSNNMWIEIYYSFTCNKYAIIYFTLSHKTSLRVR